MTIFVNFDLRRYSVKYTERKEFLYDPEVFGRGDVQTALKIYHEYIEKFSPAPRPQFFEVDKGNMSVDPLWHSPVEPRTQFTARTPLNLPAINRRNQKPGWKKGKAGLTLDRRDFFLVSNISLQHHDYFPTRGDMVYWMGYRFMIDVAVPDDESYWGQTGVWLGMAIEGVVVPEGDARPIVDLSKPVPAEQISEVRV